MNGAQLGLFPIAACDVAAFIIDNDLGGRAIRACASYDEANAEHRRLERAPTYRGNPAYYNGWRFTIEGYHQPHDCRADLAELSRRRLAECGLAPTEPTA